MARRIKNIDRATPMLLPVDLREWVREDDLVHFVIESVEGFDLQGFAVNERGTGSEQYPPSMMLSLLIYSYANGVFGSRRIEAATYRDVAVRYLCAGTHPDHDTICEFRRRNFEAVADCFLKVLLLARELKLLRVGNVSVDGTRLDANASKYRNVTYARAGELIDQLETEIKAMLEAAEAADRSAEGDPGALPPELARRQQLKQKLAEARARLEEQARRRAEAERSEYERKVAERQKRGGRKGRPPKPPQETPRADEQINLTDADSHLMRRSVNDTWRQAYNPQAVVDADGSQLVLGARVCNSSVDTCQLVPDIDSVPSPLARIEAVLADAGYGDGKQVEELQNRGIEVLVNVQAEAAHLRRTHDFRPAHRRRERPAEPKAPWRKAMKAKLETVAGRALYAKRWCTVEPVFGIIKAAMGFRRFLLRGLEKVSGEWQLVCLAYNFRRLHRLQQTSSSSNPRSHDQRALNTSAFYHGLRSPGCLLSLRSVFRFTFLLFALHGAPFSRQLFLSPTGS